MEKLGGVSVKNTISKKFVHRFNAPDSRYSSKYLKLNSYQKRIQEDKKQMKLYVVKSGFDSRMGIVRVKKEKNILVTRKAKRVRILREPQTYLDIRELIEKEVIERWKSCIPITRPKIYSFKKSRYVIGD